jgi:hypothetical protein
MENRRCPPAVRVHDIFPAASHRRNVFVDTPKCLAAIPILAKIMMNGCLKDRGLFKHHGTRIVSKNVQAKNSC